MFRLNGFQGISFVGILKRSSVKQGMSTARNSLHSLACRVGASCLQRLARTTCANCEDFLHKIGHDL